MITAVDSNVLLDIFTADGRFGISSRRAISDALGEGTVMACDVVWAEVGGAFSSIDLANDAMTALDVRFDALDPEVAIAAGTVWRRHRSEGGERDRLMADFLIGTHAWMRAERFVTRDRGFYRRYFERLRIIDPSEETPR